MSESFKPGDRVRILAGPARLRELGIMMEMTGMLGVVQQVSEDYIGVLEDGANFLIPLYYGVKDLQHVRSES